MAFDLTFGTLTHDALQALWDYGCRIAIIGIDFSNIPLTVSDVQNAQAFGFEVQLSCYLYFGGDTAARGALAASLAKTLGVTDVRLDCEDGGNGVPGIPDPARLPPSRIVQDILDASRALSGLDGGIYTRRTWWEPATAGSTLFQAQPLWDADYDGDPSLQSGFIPYGGWSQREAKQYSDNVTIDGVLVDLSMVAP